MNEKTNVKSEIKTAFLKLLIEKPYLEITVTDIVKKAQVARMSFYRNFNSVNDVLENIANEILSKISTYVLPVLKDNSERKWRELLFSLFYHFIDLQKQFGIPNKDFDNSHNNVILSRVRKKFLEMVSELPSNNIEENYITFGKINLVIGIFMKWVSLGSKEPPEEIVNLIMCLLNKLSA